MTEITPDTAVDNITDPNTVETQDAAPPLPPEEQAPKITDEEREAFFKAFLMDEPYMEEFQLFRGKLKVVFRTLSLDENDQVFRQIKFDQNNGIAASDDSYFVKIVEYRLAGALVSLNDDPFCEGITLENTPANEKAGTTYITNRVSVMQKWPTFKLGAITEAFNRFEKKVKALTEDASQENF
jgi:hypothetical protein